MSEKEVIKEYVRRYGEKPKGELNERTKLRLEKGLPEVIKPEPCLYLKSGS